jgi:hypothetical protein
VPVLARLQKAPLAALTAAFLGTIFTMAAAPASASSAVSGSPSVDTPYCTVSISGSTVGAEQCYTTQADMNAALPAITYVIGVDYKNANYGGASLTWTGISTCSGYPYYLASSMPSGWNDVISSYHDYSNCNHNPHWENNKYGGAVVNCGPNCSYVGAAMNDRTSSEKWGSY